MSRSRPCGSARSGTGLSGLRHVGCVLAGVVALCLADGAGAFEFVRGPGPPSEQAGARIPLSAVHPAPRARVLSGRIVVKYREAVDECAHCIFDRGGAFETVTGTDSLDRLHARLGAHGARPLFFERHGMKGGEARAAFRDHIHAVHARFPARAARARAPEAVPDLTGVYELEISEAVDPVAAAELYAGDPAVAYAHPVREVRADYTPNDPYFSSSGSWGQAFEDLWGLHAMNASTAWDTSVGAGAVIAIVDSGVDSGHPDLAANMWTNAGEIAANGIDDDGNGYVDDVLGWNFDGSNSDTFDRFGHGTWVGGIAAAVGDDGAGVLGAAWGARIMPVKGLGDDGWGSSLALARGVLYAAENGADVINASFGGFGLDNTMYETIEAATALGSVFVAAAGNDGRAIDDLLWLPAAHPDGLTVGALEPGGTLASFSNHGPYQSVTAPGVDVLATRSSVETFDSSLDVGASWIRASGTSAAAPYASGVAALVVAAQPGLTPPEVRWHVELNADQPGYPGYEGARHNPVYGFGRLDAATVFTTPPVTTRFAPPNVKAWHSFPESEPVPGRPGRFLFTASDPVPWDVSTPTGLAATTPSGTGAHTLDLEIRAAGLAPGTYAGDVTLAAPQAVDGGAAFSPTLHVHQDERVGPPITVGTEGWGALLGFSPASASNGVATLVAWMEYGSEAGVRVAVIDGSGNVTGPTRVTTSSAYDLAVATDGHDFIVGWIEFPWRREAIQFVRVRPTGELIDDVPIRVYSRPYRTCRFHSLAGIGHDGQDYWFAIVRYRFCTASDALYLLRVGSDGSFTRSRQAGEAYLLGEVFGCRTGSCLLAWTDWRVEAVDPGTGKYIRSGYALPLVGSEPVSEPVKVATDVFGFADLATDGSDYLALTQRYHFCAAGDLCRTEVLGVRISGAGQPLDPDGIVISNAPPVDRVYPWPGGVSFDGSEWVASYQGDAVNDSPFDDGSYVFVNRLAPDGAPQAQEYLGTLVDAAGRASESRVSSTATESVVLWEDGRSDPLLDDVYPHPDFSDHLAQRLLPHEPGADYPDREIGSIGTIVVGEGELLRFRVGAPGVDPASATFSAAGLPPGSTFDPLTRLFQWRPDGAQAGFVAIVTFTADSGATNVNETALIAVAERIASISGRVRLADGTPVGGVVLRVAGTSHRYLKVVTGSDGRYRVEGLRPGKTVKIWAPRQTRRKYAVRPRSISRTAVAGDLFVRDFVVNPK